MYSFATRTPPLPSLPPPLILPSRFTFCCCCCCDRSAPAQRAPARVVSARFGLCVKGAHGRGLPQRLSVLVYACVYVRVFVVAVVMRGALSRHPCRLSASVVLHPCDPFSRCTGSGVPPSRQGIIPSHHHPFFPSPFLPRRPSVVALAAVSSVVCVCVWSLLRTPFSVCMRIAPGACPHPDTHA